MKNINFYIAILFFVIFDYEIHFHADGYPWTWFIIGLLNIIEWIRYTIVTEIKEYIDKIKL